MNTDDEMRELQETVRALQARVEKLESQLALSRENSITSNLPAEPFTQISDGDLKNAFEPTSNSANLSQSAQSKAVHVRASESAVSDLAADAELNADSTSNLAEGLQSPNAHQKPDSDAQIGTASDSAASAADSSRSQSDESVHANVPPPLPHSKPVTESLETKIGLYWLSKLGMAFVVLGVALLIGYSFQYFGPVAKISTGFVISLLLVAAGEFFERKQKLPGFGQVLCGGGWSLAYFTSYAMHHIESVRLVPDPVSGTILMVCVALSAAFHSFKKNSELVASLAVCLGYLTLSLSNLNLFAGISSTVLTLVLAFMVAKKKWATLYLAGLLSAFSILLLAIEPKLAGAATADVPLYLSFLVPYILAAGILPTILREDSSIARSGAAAVNVVGSSVLLLCLMHVFGKLSLPVNSNALAFGIVTVVYAIFSLFARQRGCPDNALTNSLIALSSLTLFMPALNNNEPTLAAWAVELGLLLYVGIKYQLRSFRFFSLLLSLCLSIGCIIEAFSPLTIDVMGLSLPRALPRILPAAIVLAAACWLFQSNKTKGVSNLSEGESKLSFYWYAHCAGSLLWLSVPALIYCTKLVQGEAANRVLVFCWMLEAFGLGFIGLKWQRSYFSLSAIIGFLVCGSCWLLPGAHHMLPWGLQLAFMAYLSYCFRSSNGGDSLIIHRAYALIVSFFMTFVPPNTSEEIRAAIWSAELLGLSILAYRLRDLFFRNLALVGALLVFEKGMLDAGTSWTVVSTCAAALAGGAYFIRKSDYAMLGEGELALTPKLMNVGAATVMANFIGNHLQNSLVSVGWAIEGVVLLAIGFAAKDKVLRICGLLSFSLVILRLLFVDLSGANTIYRIIAFIVAGVLFMAAAYAYARFNKKSESAEETPGMNSGSTTDPPVESTSSTNSSFDANAETDPHSRSHSHASTGLDPDASPRADSVDGEIR